MKETTNSEILSLLNCDNLPEQKLVYQLLDRCLQDCKYFVDICRNPLFLWGKNVETHVRAMRVFYDYLCEKPEWISTPMIDYFEIAMKYAVGDTFESNRFSGVIKKVSIQKWYSDGFTERKRAFMLVQLDSGTENAFYVSCSNI